MSKSPYRERILALLDHWWGKSPIGSQWLRAGPLQIYMRKTPFMYRDQLVNGITLANITIHPRAQNKGLFREVVRWMERQNVDVLRVENVITPRMEAILRKHGWESDEPKVQIPPFSFYKEIKK